MKYRRINIEGALILEQTIFKDERGFFSKFLIKVPMKKIPEGNSISKLSREIF